jgi:hypothetical protein
MVVEGDAILGRFMFQEGCDASKVFGVLQKSVEEYALFHVTPNVDIAAFLLIGEGIDDSMSKETIGVRCKKALDKRNEGMCE